MAGESISKKENSNDLIAGELRHYKMLAEVEDYAIILLDENGYVLNWNKGAEKIKQYTESEIVGSHFSTFYLEEDQRKNLPEIVLGRARKEGKVVHEGWRKRKDGTRFWGSVTITALHNQEGKVIGFLKVTRDLTDKKIFEDQLKETAAQLRARNKALKQSEERYHKMIAEIQDYAIILLDQDGTILNWNKGAEKIKQYTANEIIGKNFSIFYLPEDQKTGLPNRLINEAKKHGRAVHEGKRVKKDGSTFWGSISITALHDEDNNVIGFSKVTRDLTEKKAAEDQLLRHATELEEKNHELEQFAYITSHDLQEPLRKIQVLTSIIQNSQYDENTFNTYFAKITAAAKRMSELIKSVLNYSRLNNEEVKSRPVNLNEIISLIKTDYELLIKEKQATINNDDLPIVLGDPSQLSQLFANLIGNAIKFTETNPIIHISSSVVEWKNMVHRPGFIKGEKFHEITITDNGIGFDEIYLEQIFTIFQRLHGRNEYAGTGIGLALCKKIVENHGGFITATSTEGKGATFYVYLPVSTV
jgi:PAS domain S-box-containing protein